MFLQLVKSTLKNLSLPIGVVMILSAGSAEANPFGNQWRPEINTDPNPQVESPTSDNRNTAKVNSDNDDSRFSCEYTNNQYTVMYRPQSQPDIAYPWAIPGKLGGGWSAQKRCQEISRRLETYRPDGLRELGITQKNNNQILCVTTDQDRSCRIVLTVPPGKDPVSTRNLVFYNLVQANKGEATEGVKTFVGNSDTTDLVYDLAQIFNTNPQPTTRPVSSDSAPINLRPFLDAEDGGTGKELKPSKPSKPSRPRN